MHKIYNALEHLAFACVSKMCTLDTKGIYHFLLVKFDQKEFCKNYV